MVSLGDTGGGDWEGSGLDGNLRKPSSSYSLHLDQSPLSRHFQNLLVQSQSQSLLVPSPSLLVLEFQAGQ